MGIPGSYQGNCRVLKPLILTASLWSLWRAQSSSLSSQTTLDGIWWKNHSENYLKVRINILLGTMTNVLHLLGGMNVPVNWFAILMAQN